ncbi:MULTISPECIES: phosphomannomutase/phosphoglucomutase [unclassified Marinimicrobium]|uniref:phosphomannomutase/phosphoglucomutase n=1 Tax=unclassified Marinimicrobium TaxID=2632100 RepID=UPI00257F2060|nr:MULTISPECIES: phosphomannomutase/phosphoglucomutase [unclassified Marinimicrobium]
MANRTSKEQRQKQARLARQKLIGALVLGVLVLNGLLGYWLYGILVTDVQDRRLEAAVEAQAEQRAQPLQDYIRELRQRVAALAAEPATAEALQGSTEVRQSAAEAIAARIEHSIAARLIPAGSARVERDHPAPIRFAELDLIRRAERRDNHLPELAKVDQQWQLHVIEPIPPSADEPVEGTLLVTLNDTGWRSLLDAASKSLGRTELHQQIPGSNPLAVYLSGQGEGGAKHSVAIPNSHWRLSFTASPELVAQTRELPTLWLLVLSTTTIGGLLLAWFSGHMIERRQRQSARPIQVPGAARSGGKNADAQDEHGEEEIGMINTLYQNQDILDLDVSDEDEDILALDQAPTKTAAADATQAGQSGPTIPEGIFRSYDIRGLADTEITPELAEHIGRALGSEALDHGETDMVLARDGRTHSPVLAEALRSGIASTGCNVIDLGTVPTPLMYFATHHLSETSSGVMVTASHNPGSYNGFKMIINGVTLADDAVLDVRSRIQRQHYHQGEGETRSHDIITDYIERIFSDVALVGAVSLVIDAGNAVPGVVAPRLFEELGCDVTPLYCDLDGTFPNHDPDPTQEANLQDLIAKVQEVGADLGAALDGDGDRLIVVTPQGRIIWPDQLLMLFARDVLGRNPGADVLFDVKCSRQLNQLVTSYGGRPIMWKTGHSHMKSKMIETGALIGGEYSGHIFIKDRWYGFDDGLYTLARLLEIITLRDQPIDDIFAAFPILPSTPELKIPVQDDQKFALVDRLIAEGDFQSGKPSTIDGLRVDFAKGWGLVRASNTSAALTLRFEGETEEALNKIQQLFKRELLKIDSQLQIDF